MASVAKRTWTHNDITKTAWVVRYTDQGGKRRLKTCDLKKEADKYRTKVEREIEKGIHTADSESITIREAADQFLEELETRHREGGIRASTIEVYDRNIRHRIVPQLGRMKLVALTAPKLHRWADEIRCSSGSISRSTLQMTFTTLQQVIALAQVRGQIATNIMIEAKPRLPRQPRKQPTIPSKDDIRLILSKADDYLKIMVHLAVLTGMRQGELRALRWQDIDFNIRTIHVRHGMDRHQRIGPPKTSASVRLIPLSPSLVTLLKEWRLRSRINELGLVFCTNRGTPLHYQTIQEKRWRPLMERLGFIHDNGRSKYNFHTLRHVAASLLIEQGENPKVIQKIMGHASVSVTFDVYGHLFTKDDAGRDSLAAIDVSLLG